MGEIDRPKMAAQYEDLRSDDEVSERIASEAIYFLATGKVRELPRDDDWPDEPPKVGPNYGPNPEDQSGGGDVIALPIPPAEKFDHFVQFALAAA